jgi:Rab GDP dissociation inhibitor
LPQKQFGCKFDIYEFCSHNVVPKGKYIAFVLAETDTDQPEGGHILLGPVNESSLDNCFISTSYDATTHFESTVQDVLAMYTRIPGTVDLSAASTAKE